ERGDFASGNRQWTLRAPALGPLGHGPDGQAEEAAIQLPEFVPDALVLLAAEAAQVGVLLANRFDPDERDRLHENIHELLARHALALELLPKRRQSQRRQACGQLAPVQPVGQRAHLVAKCLHPLFQIANGQIEERLLAPARRGRLKASLKISYLLFE